MCEERFNMYSPDWTRPLQRGYVVVRDFDIGLHSILKASTLKVNLEQINKCFEENSTISFKDKNNKKSHVNVLFYGSEDDCDEYLDRIRMEAAYKRQPKLSITNCSSPYLPDDVSVASSSSPIPDKRLKVEPASEDSIVTMNALSSNGFENDGILRSIFSIEDTVKDLDKKITALNNKVSEINYVSRNGEAFFYRPDRFVEAELSERCTMLLISRRSSIEWREKVKNMITDNLDETQEKSIKRILLFGTEHASSFLRSIAIVLFGEQRVKETLLGDEGLFLRGVRPGIDREQVFTVDEELKLINILKIVDDDFFASKDVYRKLIRIKINSYGRGRKKGNTNSSYQKCRSYNITSYFKRIAKNDYLHNLDDLDGDSSESENSSDSDEQT